MGKYFELIVLMFVIGFVAISKTTQEQETPYVILISFDGFRHDYVEKFNAPNFKAFINEGASAESMLPSFPSKTFPNHYSIVTGMYPGHHGLVDNSFYDRELDIRYGMGKPEIVQNPAFYGGTPLWQLVQQNGMKSASYFWVGSEAPIGGRLPDYTTYYDGSVPNEKRIEAVIDWLELPADERPNFITLYFSLVDSQGHMTGPDSEETGKTVLEADRLLGVLMEELKSVDLPVNVIVTSDHGMAAVPEKADHLIDYDELLEGSDRSQYRLVNNGAHAHFYIDNSDHIDSVYNFLKSKESHFRVYKKGNFPEEWHYNDHPRIGEVLVTMEGGYYLTSKSRRYMSLARRKTQGQHGFDPYVTPDMGAIFYANGPNIKAGVKVGQIKNVDVYPFVAHILGIDKLPEIDGDLSKLLPLYDK